MWCSYATTIARYGCSCCSRSWKSASTPSHGCEAIMRHSSSLSMSGLLRTSSGTRDFPRSWNSAAMPRSYSCNARQPEPATERHREDAHVHRVRERVVVVIADRREPDQRRLLIQDLVDDSLHDSLDLLDVRALSEPHRVDHVARDGDTLRVRALCGLLRLSEIRLVLGRRARHRNTNVVISVCRSRSTSSSNRSSGSPPPVARNDRSTVQSRGVTVPDDAHRPDAGCAIRREQ